MDTTVAPPYFFFSCQTVAVILSWQVRAMSRGGALRAVGWRQERLAGRKAHGRQAGAAVSVPQVLLRKTAAG